MDGFCDWCEEPATMKREDFGRSCDICDACDAKIEARLVDEWERSMSRAERKGWMKARDAGVD